MERWVFGIAIQVYLLRSLIYLFNNEERNKSQVRSMEFLKPVRAWRFFNY